MLSHVLPGLTVQTDIADLEFAPTEADALELRKTQMGNAADFDRPATHDALSGGSGLTLEV
jgi:hypothetical protein